MILPYVCPSCRHNALRRAATLRRPPTTPCATFITFGSNPQPSPRTAERSSSSNSDAQPDNWPNGSESEEKRHVAPSHPSQRPIPHARPSAQPSSVDMKNLLSVLSTSKPGRYSRAILSPHDVETQPAASASPTAVRLKEILERRPKGQSRADVAKDAWDYFDQHYRGPNSPDLKQPTLQDLVTLARGELFNKLMMEVSYAWCKGLRIGLPRPTHVVEKYIHLRIMASSGWPMLLWRLGVETLKQVDSPQWGRPAAKILAELMDLWSKCFEESKGHDAAPRKTVTDMWSSMPPLHTLSLRTAGVGTPYFPNRLIRFFKTVNPDGKFTLSKAALVTFDLLTRQNSVLGVSDETAAKYKPFSDFIAHLLPNAMIGRLVDSMEDDLIAHGITPPEVSGIGERIRRLPVEAMPIIGVSNRITGRTGEKLSIPEQQESFYLKRIARALEQKRPDMVDLLWKEICRVFPQQADPKASGIPRAIYDSILEAYMALHNPEQAVEVWNTMVANGIKPTIKTWTAMLTGCRNARDIKGLEQIWARMIASGAHPDAHAWSTRIYGHMSCRQINQGIELLDEMGQTWLEAYKCSQRPDKKKKGHAPVMPPKPSTEILNSVVTVLSRLRKKKQLTRVLAWGRSYNIKPDVVTFNALIHLSLHNGDAQEGMNLLQQMEEASVQPDVATFTVILNCIFQRNSAAVVSSPEEQTEKVMGVLDNLEKRGFTANAWVFSTLIDHLLNVHGNQLAAKAVLFYMDSKKIPLSPHVYTILMSHYFAKQPPDYAAIDALWNQIQTSDTVVDAIFYDRMIERYGAVGDVGKMMAFLGHMSKAGKTPGWTALGAVVRELANIGHWERLEEIVDDVKNGAGIARKGLRPAHRTTVDDFWMMVESTLAKRPKGVEGARVGGDSAAAPLMGEGSTAQSA